MTLDDFTADAIRTGETRIFVRQHEFPQTHVMWRGVAPLLARGFTVACADLRGYGRSGCPASAPDHAPYAKRAMAHDMVAVRLPLARGRDRPRQPGRIAAMNALFLTMTG